MLPFGFNCMKVANVYTVLLDDFQINFIHDIIKQSPSKISYGSYVYLDKGLLLGVRKAHRFELSYRTYALSSLFSGLVDWEPGGGKPHCNDAVHMMPSA